MFATTHDSDKKLGFRDVLGFSLISKLLHKFLIFNLWLVGVLKFALVLNTDVEFANELNGVIFMSILNRA